MFLKPPNNVWGHLQAISPAEFVPPNNNSAQSVLQLLKPAYGLVEAPFLWQLSLQSFIKDTLKGHISKFDENFVTWMEGEQLVLLMVIHVDDIFVAGKPDWIHWAKTLIEKRFGAVKENLLPFTYVGIEHERLIT